MIYDYTHKLFGMISNAVDQLSPIVISEMEQLAGEAFPFDALDGVAEAPTYEGLEKADRLLKPFTTACFKHLNQACKSQLFSFLSAYHQINMDKPFRKVIMPEYVVDDHGGLTAIPHFAPQDGRVRYGSLGMAVCAGAVEATVFTKAIEAEALYDSMEALNALGDGKELPDRVGYRSDYRIAILDGEVLSPPRWPSDISAERAQDEIEQDLSL